MPLELHWPAIALRLLLTVAAGGLLGMERSRTGHAAGLRTTLLVTLAASIAMIQVNLLIGTNGKPQSSYIVMDLMRLPLGILTGVGFIGAGAIVRKNELVIGITTAATMWFATVIGLCMGGGQLILGSVSTVIGLLILGWLRFLEARVEHTRIAELTVITVGDPLSAAELRRRLQAAKFQVKSFSMTHAISEGSRKFSCEVRWQGGKGSDDIPASIRDLEELPGITRLEWKTNEMGPG
ncbi:MAG TPA: MgtC/SapB family protein [Terracidiphilus sp.]|jgi:putative Mg2+ transporter-C (MgtC) family protein|nr:MgtC/SapB family protein [Terracidiphilus sp.]